jgi:hypothetical protein
MSKPTLKELQEQLLALQSQVVDLTNRLVESQPKPDVELPEGEIAPLPRLSSRKGKPRPGVSYELLGVPSEEYRIQPQAKKVCVVLSRAVDPKNISEKEAMRLIKTERVKQFFGTVQDPWRIFGYYKGKLISENFLREHKA